MGRFQGLVPELPLDAFFTEVIGQTPDKIARARRAFLEGIRTKILFGSQWETIHAKLKTW